MPKSITTFSDFAERITQSEAPVILIEGRRSILESGAESARRLAAMLAKQFPTLRFRSGNATGSDQAFASGVIDVAPERLEIIAPYASHRARGRHPLVRYESPESLTPEELADIQALTIAVSPENHRLMQRYGKGGRADAQAACLIRDTLKVTGFKGESRAQKESARRGPNVAKAMMGMRHALPSPLAALFWIDPADPEAGGTGHTIRACRLQHVPVIFQCHWQSWLAP